MKQPTTYEMRTKRTIKAIAKYMRDEVRRIYPQCAGQPDEEIKIRAYDRTRNGQKYVLFTAQTFYKLADGYHSASWDAIINKSLILK